MTTVIPGHGPLGGRAEIETQIRYLTELRERVADAISRGLTLEAAAKTVSLDGYPDYRRAEGLPDAIGAVYQEMRQNGE